MSKIACSNVDRSTFKLSSGQRTYDKSAPDRQRIHELLSQYLDRSLLALAKSNGDNVYIVDQLLVIASYDGFDVIQINSNRTYI